MITKMKVGNAHNTDLVKDRLIAGLLTLAEDMRNAGFKPVLFTPEDVNSPTWDIFDQLNGVQQKKILNDFEVNAGVMNSVIAANKDWSDNTSTLWAAIKSLGVLPSNDIFTSLEPDDVIEVYRSDNLQVFRNMQFHDICSYHLHDLFIRPWNDLFIRKDFITSEIQKAVIYLFGSEPVDNLYNLDYLPEHSILENNSPGMFVMRMKEKFLAPLRDRGGNILYIVAVSKVKVVEKDRSLNRSYELKL